MEMTVIISQAQLTAGLRRRIDWKSLLGGEHRSLEAGTGASKRVPKPRSEYQSLEASTGASKPRRFRWLLRLLKNLKETAAGAEMKDTFVHYSETMEVIQRPL